MTPNPIDAPPPWWQGPLTLFVFMLLIAALVIFCTSCTCTLDGESLVRSIIIYQTK